MTDASSAPVSRRFFIAGLMASGAACAVPAAAQRMAGGVRPEQFGAAADGRRDDSRAFAAALEQAVRSGAPLLLAANAHYALGSRGWRGLSAAGRGVSIEGNGATLHLKAVPVQGFAAGEGNPLLRIAGGAANIRNLNVDLGGLAAAAFEGFESRVRIEGCSFVNGAGQNLSFGLYLNRCSGVISGNRAERIGHFIYAGHTDPRQHSFNLEIAGNRANGLSADFVVGVLKDSVIRDNVADGMYGGVGLSAFDRMGSFSENVTITGNSFSNFTGNGIQTDVIGNIRVRNITIRNNVLRRGIGPIAAGLYLLRIDRFEAADNIVEDSAFGVVLDAASNGRVTGNRIVGGARGARNGVMLVGDGGPVEDVLIDGNEVSGYDIGLASGGSPKGGVRRVRIVQNAFRNGGHGLSIVAPAAEIDVSGNSLSDNRRGAVAVSVPGVTMGANR